MLYYRDTILAMEITTRSVWSIYGNEYLLPRIFNPAESVEEPDSFVFDTTDPGNLEIEAVEEATQMIQIDESHTMLHLNDIGTILPVSSGLTERDFAVILQFKGKNEGRKRNIKRTFGYLVSKASADGSGVLVDSTAISEKGNDLLKDKQFLDKLIFLQQIEPNVFEEFNLKDLANIIREERQLRQVLGR
jgi:hypothetical protein